VHKVIFQKGSNPLSILIVKLLLDSNLDS